MAMWIVILITLLAFLILEYIIPYGKNVKWIENSSKAYYQAQSWIEQALLDLADPNNQTGFSTSTNNTQVVAYNYSIIGSWRTLPRAWEWNSEYDNNWNIIAPGQPIQLEIGNNIINWATATFHFRKPTTWSNQDLQWNAWPIINWQVWSADELLSAATNNYITADDINADAALNISNRQWNTLEAGNGITIDSFYNDNVTWPGTPRCGTNSECTLRFAIVNPLLLNTGSTNRAVKIPYLEWQFRFDNDVPLRYANIESDGTSFGFKKQLEIKVPQQTIVEAFDFTVFQ